MPRTAIVIIALIIGACGTEPDDLGVPQPAPDGMVYVPAGVTTFGSEDAMANEQPVFEAEIAAFFSG